MLISIKFPVDRYRKHNEGKENEEEEVLISLVHRRKSWRNFGRQ